MRLRIGTSGYSYKEWKGGFYPEKLKNAEMLTYYSGRLASVEINNTFYRMPEPELLERWAVQVAANPEFVFVLKAPQRITHVRRLKEAAQDVAHFFDVAASLGSALGAVLFQLPPYLKKDAVCLKAFLSLLPSGSRAAFEFRHETWYDDEIEGLLREAGAAFVVSESEKAPAPERALTPTTSWGYLRLRRCDYNDAMLETWVQHVQAQPWDEAFVFFKHEDEGKGPDFALRFRTLTQCPGS